MSRRAWIPTSRILWMAALWGALASAWFPCVAHAFTFTRTGNGTAQNLSYIWLGTYGNCTLNHTCGGVNAVDGKIPLSSYVSDLTWANITIGGALDWTTGPGQLHAVELPAGSIGVSFDQPNGVWVDGSTTLDARTTPLSFQVVAEAGDPPFTRIQITPFLDGTVGLFPALNGQSTTASANLQMYMRVEVNQQQVSRDSLVTSYVSHDGLAQVIPVAFPNGAANTGSAVVTSGSVVSIYLWTYITMHAAGTESYVLGETATYGQGTGPAIVVDVQDVGTTGVSEMSAASGLRVGVRPNPSAGRTRLSYAIPRPTDVRLSVYDLTGARVATLVDRFESAGGGEVAWDGTDSHGRRVAPGMYVVELMAGGERVRGKLVILGR